MQRLNTVLKNIEDLIKNKTINSLTLCCAIEFKRLHSAIFLNAYNLDLSSGLTCPCIVSMVITAIETFSGVLDLSIQKVIQLNTTISMDGKKIPII